MDFYFIKYFLGAIFLITINMIIQYFIYRNEVDKVDGWTAVSVIYFLMICLLLSA